MKKQLLFTPGPVNVNQNLKTAICQSDICHREVEFEVILNRIEKNILHVLKVENVADYSSVVITGSGTAANESILSSVVGNKEILVISNGEFGERLHRISTVYNTKTHLLEFPWGSCFDLDVIEDYLIKHSISFVAMVHHETSSGLLNSLEGVAKLTKKYSAKLILDCVSSAGAEIIPIEKLDIDFISSSSSKAMGSYAGLSFVVAKKQEFEKLKNIPAKTMYLNLYEFYRFIRDYSQTPNTPAVPLFYAFDQALCNIISYGIDRHYLDIKAKSNMLRRGMLNLGLEFLIAQKDMCSILTAVYLPENIDSAVLRQELRDKSIIIYEGKGCFKGLVFQVGNIGEVSILDIQYFLNCLKIILNNIKPNNLKTKNVL